MSDDIKNKAQEELAARARKALWERGDLRWKLHSAQLKIDDTINSLGAVREALLLISRRFGKSYYAVVKAMETCLKKPGCNVLIIGPTEKQTKVIVTPLINKISSDAPEGLVKATKSEGIWTVGKSTIRLSGFDSCIESVRGTEYDLIIVEETGAATAVEDYEYIIKSVLRPTLMHSRGPIIHVSTPSKDVAHPLHTITLPKTKLTNSFFKFTIRDNPLLTPEQIEEEIAELGGEDSEHCQRELFCNIIRSNSLVAVPNFDVTKNVKDVKLPKTCYKWLSGDFGGARDKSVFHIMAYDYLNAKVLVLDERKFDRNTPTSTIVSELRVMEAQWDADSELRYIDCPGQIRVDLVMDHNFIVSILNKEKGSFEAGLNQLNMAFKLGKLEVDSRCTFTITTLETGMLNPNRTDFARTEDLGHCDALASLAYGFRNRIIEMPIFDVSDTKDLPNHKVESRMRKRVGGEHPLSIIFDE